MHCSIVGYNECTLIRVQMLPRVSSNICLLVQRSVQYSDWLHSKERTLHLKTTERRWPYSPVFVRSRAVVGLQCSRGLARYSVWWYIRQLEVSVTSCTLRVLMFALAMHQSQVNQSSKGNDDVYLVIDVTIVVRSVQAARDGRSIRVG